MIAGSEKEVLLRVNGENYRVRVESTDTLAGILRERLGLTGTKIMCDHGECGACTVLLDGKPVLSCLKLACECEGSNILTIEGLADKVSGVLHPVQQAFVDLSGMQCGVCTPGMILTAKFLLDKNPEPTERDIREALAGNLCRCGNYNRIVECIQAASRAMPVTSSP